MKQTKDIGQLKERILVFGGVYSNFQALEKMRKIAEAEQIPPSNIICTGDIVGYCAEPDKCLQAIKNWGIHSILGNVEIQLRDDAADCGCNFDDASRCDLLSKQWFTYAQQNISPSSKSWLHSLPDYLTFTFAGQQITVVHGSYTETSEFIFKSTPWPVKQQQLQAANADVILAGHCGLPFSTVQETKHWLNAGVIGMPANDGTTRVWYMILEDNPFRFEHRYFEYDYHTAQQLMIDNHLPTAYATTLSTGLWDNCDILPKTETNEQGIALTFE